MQPICGPCSNDNRPDDCEYRDPHGFSRTRYLEENIRRLEARLRDLENPVHSDSRSIGLHLPYTQAGTRADWWKDQEPPAVMRERLSVWQHLIRAIDSQPTESVFSSRLRLPSVFS